MKTYYLNGEQLNELIEKTDAEIMEGFDGCLIDNGLYSSNIGSFAVYEHYVNSNMSDYMTVIPETEEEENEIIEEFYKIMEKAEEEDECYV